MDKRVEKLPSCSDLRCDSAEIQLCNYSRGDTIHPVRPKLIVPKLIVLENTLGFALQLKSIPVGTLQHDLSGLDTT